MKAVNTIFGFEVMTCYHLVALSLLPFLPRILGLQNYTYQDLQLCALNTVELSNLGPGDNVEPCVIFDVQPFPNASFAERSSRISIVQVTPSTCGNHRDGAFTGVQVLNAENDGKGTAIGFNQDHYVKLRLVSVVAGNPATLSEEEYKRRHKMILRSLLTSLEAPYIIGTCSFASSIEKDPALEHKAILMAQVGPPGFYLDGNPYVFGFHINSDTYPLPNVRALEFLAAKSEAGLSSIPITVISRTKSEFFASTCRSAIDSLKSAGFTQLTELFFDHSADNDRDGEVNQFDEDFLIGLADLACPPGSGDDDSYHPALFVCTLTEHDVILRRWLETGCSPTSIWVTAATWGWATSNRKAVPYFQGGGQWHESFNYADSYFESGQDLLNHNRRVFGYFGNYDQVVSYSIPHLFSRHLASHYRVVDTPNPTSDFQDNDERELLRRGMIVLTAETLFGPVSFNEVQRNVGREAAGTQWLPLSGGKEHENALISPLLQAEAQIVIPGLNTLDCDSGSFLNDTLLLDQGGLMLKSCSECPNNTFSKVPARLKECRPCPIGSSTGELDVNEFCAFRDDNLLSSGMLAFGYTAVATTWMFSIGFISWILYHRNDAVVKVSQIEFMVLICLGAMISSSTIVALSQQAGSDDDIKAASIGCTMAPFLYAIGWVLQYACLTAKTYRLFKVMQNTERMKRKTVRFFEMFRIVLAALFADLTILVCWAALSPLVYKRTEGSRSVDEATGMVTISTVGRCVLDDSSYSPWVFAAPLLSFHFLLMVTTNVLLYKVRSISNRYQEQKYVGMASILMFEILMVGVPVFVAVNDNPSATYIVLLCFIALDDIGILCCIFMPKVLYQRKGLEEGVGVSESIMRTTYRNASAREQGRRISFLSIPNAVGNAVSGLSAGPSEAYSVDPTGFVSRRSNPPGINAVETDAAGIEGLETDATGIEELETDAPGIEELETDAAALRS